MNFGKFEVWMQNAFHGFNSFVLQTVCVEKEKSLGGTCLNVGCIPSKVSQSEKNNIYIRTHHSIFQKNWNKKIDQVAGAASQVNLPPPPLFVKNKFFFVLKQLDMPPNVSTVSV